MERRLTARGLHADVLNFGVPGYGLAQEWLTLRDHVWQYDPQIVLLVLAPFNLLRNTPEFYPGEAHGTPFFRVREDGRLEPDQSVRAAAPNPTRLRWKNEILDQVNRFSLLGMVNQARVNFVAQAGTLRERLHWRAEAASGTGALSYNETRWFPYEPDRPEMRETIEIEDALLKRFQEECRLHGAELWLVNVDSFANVGPDEPKRKAFARSIGIHSLDAADDLVRRFGAEQEIPVLCLTGPVRDYTFAHHAVLHGADIRQGDSGHWNELGHQVVGDAIARDLLSRSAVVRSWGASQ